MKPSTADIIGKYKKYIMTSCVKKLEPIVLVEGNGAKVKDVDGKEYIDCWSGISVVNTGHCNPYVVEAATKQAKKLIHVCSYVYHAVPPAQLAAKLAQIVPGKLQMLPLPRDSLLSSLHRSRLLGQGVSYTHARLAQVATGTGISVTQQIAARIQCSPQFDPCTSGTSPRSRRQWA